MTNGAEPVTIRNIDIPFWRIVVILIKWSIAAIPAAIIVGILYVLIFAIVGGIAVGVMDVLGIDVPNVPAPPPGP